MQGSQASQAFLDHGKLGQVLTPADFSVAERCLQELGQSGIDINEVCAKLLKEGVNAFVKSFEPLLDSLNDKAATLCKR